MSDFITKLSELIDPEVMGDMVSARIPKKLRVARVWSKRSALPAAAGQRRSSAPLEPTLC